MVTKGKNNNSDIQKLIIAIVCWVVFLSAYILINSVTNNLTEKVTQSFNNSADTHKDKIDEILEEAGLTEELNPLGEDVEHSKRLIKVSINGYNLYFGGLIVVGVVGVLAFLFTLINVWREKEIKTNIYIFTGIDVITLVLDLISFSNLFY